MTEIAKWHSQKLAALWLTEGCSLEDASALLALDWPLIWSSIKEASLTQLLKSTNRVYKVIDARADLPPEAHKGNVSYIYNVARSFGSTPQSLLKNRRAAELENMLEGWVGSIVVVGTPDREISSLFEALAPSALLFQIATRDVHLTGSQLAENIRYNEAAEARSNALQLKNSRKVALDNTLLDPISDSWDLLTIERLQPSTAITQQDFDDFLSGEAAWRALATGVAMPRKAICEVKRDETVDPVAYIKNRVVKIDEADLDPSDALSRVRIFAETGSGCTTLLRQAAIRVAQSGYPVLMTRPFARQLRVTDIVRLIISIQDEWAEQRHGKGSGSGTLPCCIFIDADAEFAAHSEGFLRQISNDLNRKIVVVTAHRRSRDELEDSRNTLRLYARTSEDELYAIGRWLAEYCGKWKLAAIPSESDWKTYYNSFGRLRVHEPSPEGALIQSPALFLIGLYPFIKERVRDHRSLTRYLYDKWASISDPNLRSIITILACASSYGCAMPLECLLRDVQLATTLKLKNSKEDDRFADLFIEWARFGDHTRNWALHIRHPVLGGLLINAILPHESQAPYSAIIPILQKMSGTTSDIWLCEQLAFRLGRYFHSESSRFSLLSDTPIQLASRNIFNEIPEAVSEQSRVIKHHYARYFIHLAHACLEGMFKESALSLPSSALIETAITSVERAEKLVVEAQGISTGRDKSSNLLTTLSAAALRIAVALLRKKDERAVEYFMKSISFGRQAVDDDIANGHAIFTYINGVQKFLSNIDFEAYSPNLLLQLFTDAEHLLHNLFNLQKSRLWRNVEDADAELSILDLLKEHNKIAKRLNRSPIVGDFIARTPAAQAVLKLRSILDKDSIDKAFLFERKAEELRELRGNLDDSTFRAEMLDLRYKLYVFDPNDRFNFEVRESILTEMALHRQNDYLQYIHDHAALAFQLEQLERSEKLFQDLREYRAHNPEMWMWRNERIFVDRSQGDIRPRRVVIRVTDAVEGWATYDNRVKVKIQPRQWGDVAKGTYLDVFLRFRMTGVQAIDSKYAARDLASITGAGQSK